ncbi:MerR family transcriptional regulator [Peribacillus muralis]|uniref:MerR family transcriptional regulator n=1 Tax=Peribacillus muralis TaxID=264697 RepID=UPI001F4D4706|nr:MerR family transcriptional regulator [Peribacillus muralis]MCK1991349.1 MerR family transcriptional regulator [Peribacillus muralis]MCK2011903.1 MerR family transcriptional regulator [Peribacillus muralis]
MQEGKYNIKAVSKLLNIQPGTLRAWERRYKFIEPVRNESGHRLYTEKHLQSLKWLINKTNQGFTISQAVSLLESSGSEERGLTENRKDEQTIKLSDDLVEALLNFNENKAQMLISQAFSMYTIEHTIVNVLGSILVLLGDKWENGEITSAHEHFASNILKARISSIMHTIPTNGFLPKALTVCAPGEKHEFGLLIFTIFLKRKGYETIYLGESIADNDLFAVLDIIKPRYLFMSCSLQQNLEATLQLVEALKSRFLDVKVGVGGAALSLLSEEKREALCDVVMGETQADWEKWLKV